MSLIVTSFIFVNMCFLIQDCVWRLNLSLECLSRYPNEISCLRNLVSRTRALILFATHFFFLSISYHFPYDPSNSSAVIPTYTSLLGYVVSFNIHYFTYFISNECISGTRVIVNTTFPSM